MKSLVFLAPRYGLGSDIDNFDNLSNSNLLSKCYQSYQCLTPIFLDFPRPFLYIFKLLLVNGLDV